MNRSNFLRAALKTIEGPREEIYGSAEENHQRIAAAWSNILTTEVTVPQVYACMIAVKLSRLTHSPDHLDSWLDIAAYAALAGETVPDTTGQVEK